MECTLKVVRGNKRHPFKVKLKITEDRIWFMRQPFSKVLNAEIKSMSGYKWHGFQDPPVKKWSIAHCPRNVLQLRRLMGENIFEWFEQPLCPEPDFNRPEYAYYDATINGAQIDMVRRGLTYHYQIWAAEQGLGKSLAAIELMERSGKKNWWYVGPKSALASVEREFKKWNLDDSIRLTTMTYQGLTTRIRYDFDEIRENCPDGLILDESDSVKTPTTKMAEAAQCLADLIRQEHEMEGYVIEMCGTPSAKHPTDWWSQCEIAWPGFLREGSFSAFEHRYAIIEEKEDLDGVKYFPRVGWHEHEVAALPDRYAGLATVYRKSEWLPDLPPKTYRTVRMVPSNKVLRVAKSLANIASNTITALTWLRALSSGFQYTQKQIEDKVCPVCKGAKVYEHPEEDVCPGCLGEGAIPDYEREAKQVQTPKDAALREELDLCESHGRIVVAASFQGSIDRILKICKERGWAVACVDGRGWRAYDAMGNTLKDIDALDLWEQHEGKVAFVGNPGSCRYGLTLTLAHTLVFYDNNFSAVQRLQMEDRIHRQSMGEFANIVDFIHLEVDQLVVDTLKANKKLELLSLGAINETVGLDYDDDDFEEIVLD